ncbi:MAG: acetyl-CoA carboxylase biotin carboxyl carrier protein [Gammaproteobacteria bacterium]
MDIRKVKKLIELLEESGIAEIEITEGEEAVRISRFPTSSAPQAPAVAPGYAAAPAAAAPTVAAAATPAPAEPRPPVTSGTEISAPMVGTFYSAAGPGAKPFVEIGSDIAVGDTVCIIEAMKMMNQIESEVAGRIVNIQVENGEPVEFGQAMFIVE